MLRNLLTVCVRNLRQNLNYTLLHILGLTLGITCTIFISLYVLDELSYDQFHAKKDRIHRIVTTIVEGGKESYYASTQVPVSVELESKYPQVERAVRMQGAGRELFENPERDLKFYEEKFYFTDASVFEVFSFPLIAGDPKTALVKPNTAVVTPATAERYFGTTDALGKTFMSKGKAYTVTGIAEEAPANSSTRFDALLSYSSFPSDFGTWDSWYPETFVLVAEHHTAADVESALAQLSIEKVMPLFKSFGVDVRYWLQPVTDIHLKSGFDQEGGDAYDYIYIFLAIAVFVIIIACINYINLASARATRRAKEIGIRKTIGSTNTHIVIQFISESLVLTMMSLLLSMVLVVTLMPYFNDIAGKSITLAFLMQPKILLGCFALALGVGIVGGSYPAFYISYFSPSLVLKGIVSRGTSNAVLRKVLVATQFAISIAMLICTAVVYDQLQYMQNKDLGFNRDQVLHVELADSETMFKESILTNKLKSHPQIIDVASSSSMPGKGINYTLMMVDSPEGKVSQGVYHYFAGYDYIQTMGMTITKGRNFSREFSDTTSVLVNEAMVKSMKWDDPIGKRLLKEDGNPATYDRIYFVVGVVRDFHQSSLHSPITPLAIVFSEPNYFLNIKIQPNDLQATLDIIKQDWTEVTNGKPFSYSFLDADFQAQYKADEKRGQIFTLFSAICMVISCVGLFGFAAYTTEQRAKEIGIRKVNGATIPNIVRLFYIDFLKLIIIGLVIAFPLSYLVMNNWLETFAYQTELRWITFAGAAFITLLITMGSISFHTIRAATTNPVKILRSE